MNKRMIRIISLVVSSAMILTLPINTVFAVENGQIKTNNISNEYEKDFEQLEPDLSPELSNDESQSGSQNLSEKYEEVTIESLVDSNGFLTDEGLISLQSLPYEPEKYAENVDNGDGTQTLKLYTGPIKYKNDKGEFEYIDNSIVENSSNGSYKN